MNDKLETVLAILAFAMFVGAGYVLMHFIMKFW